MTEPVAQPDHQTRERPRQVTITAILLVVFGALSLMLAMLLLSVVNDEDVAAWVYGLVAVQFLLSGAQILSGIFVWLGRAWARTVATVVCSVNLVGAVLSLASGAVPQAITAGAVNIALLRMLRGRDVTEWCE